METTFEFTPITEEEFSQLELLSSSRGGGYRYEAIYQAALNNHAVAVRCSDGVTITQLKNRISASMYEYAKSKGKKAHLNTLIDGSGVVLRFVEAATNGS